MKKTLSRFIADESGATAIEYGFIALIIGLGIISSLQGIAGALTGIFDNVGSNVN